MPFLRVHHRHGGYVDDVAHIIAGSVNAFYVLMAGDASLALFVGRFLVPTLLGNIFGGVAFVAAINHAQVDPESCRDAQDADA